MTFRDGRCWSGSAASRAANREPQKGLPLFSGISFRLRAALLMTSRVRGRINGGIGGCWGWNSGAGNDSEWFESSLGRREFLTQRSQRTQRAEREKRQDALVQSVYRTRQAIEKGREG